MLGFRCLVVVKVALGHFFSDYFGFPPSVLHSPPDLSLA